MKSTGRVLILLFFIMSFNTTAYSLVNPWLTQTFLSYFHYDYTASELTNLSYNLLFVSALTFLLSPAYLVLSPVVGFFSDRVGRKKILIGLNLCTCLAFLTLLLSAHLMNKKLMLFGTFILGVEVAIFPIIIATALDITRGKQRALSIGGLFFAGSIVMAITLQAMKYVLKDQLLTTHTAIQIASISLLLELICLLLIWFLLPETLQHLTKKSRQLPALGDSLFINKKLIFLLLLSFILYLCWGLIHQAIYPHLTQQQNYTDKLATRLLQVITLIMVLTLAVIYPFLINKINLKKILISCSLFSSFSILALIYSSDIILIFIAQLFFASSIALAIPSLITLLGNACQNKHYGVLMGSGNVMWAMGWLLSSNVDTAANTFSIWRHITLASVLVLIALTSMLSKRSMQLYIKMKELNRLSAQCIRDLSSFFKQSAK